MEDDPEFLALSEKQRRNVDKAFDRGVRRSGGRPAKRRRLTRSAKETATSSLTPATATPGPSGGGGFLDEDDAGGFIPDDDGGGFMPDEGGGFMLDDDMGGGFIPDDDAGGFIPDDDAGGFLPDDSGPSTRAGPSRLSSKAGTGASTPVDGERVPLRVIPSLLSTLGLPCDKDVLDVFRASASGWSDGGSAEEGAVSRTDFRAVCAALMEPGDGERSDDDGDDDAQEEAFSSDSEDSDVFRPSDDDDDDGMDEDVDDDGEYGVAPRKPPPKRRTRAAALEEAPRIKLTSQQRDLAKDLWAMLKPDAKEGRGILGRDEVKTWVRELGEMWSDDEITDMVKLFSSQHEGRGLSFDDFGAVMLRAGLV